MPRSRHHRKRRAGTKKRGRRGGFTSAVSPRLSQIQSPMSKSMSASPARTSMQVSRPVSPPMKLASNRPALSPSNRPASNRPLMPSNKSFKNTLQGHMDTAKNAVQKGITGALSGLSNLMGGRKSRRRRTHKRRSRVRKVRKHKTYKKRKHKHRRH